MIDPGGQHQAGSHEQRACDHHRTRPDPIGNMARGGTEEKIDECGYREDRRDCRAAGMKLGGHRLDESAETVGHREQREHREKRGEYDYPGPRRIRLGRQDAQNDRVRRFGRAIRERQRPSVAFRVFRFSAHRYPCAARRGAAASAASYSRRRSRQTARPLTQAMPASIRHVTPKCRESVKMRSSNSRRRMASGAPPCNKDVSARARPLSEAAPWRST